VKNVFRAGPVCVSLALVLVASGCGGGSSAMTATTRAPLAAPATTAAKPASAPTSHLSILSPRVGAHTASPLTVRVALSGAPTGVAQRFRYVLDRRLTRSGSARLTFHDLAPGRHRLEVLSAADNTVRASTTFTVRAPAPVATPAPTRAQPTVPTPAPAPTTATPPTRTPPPTKTTAPAPPKASPPPASGGIPQGPNAGDGDEDNNGAPSDGDGNL
jgi:hypothetical protein